MKARDGQIYVTDANGKELEGELIFEFTENGDDYVVYGIIDTIYVAKYNAQRELFPVEADEWNLVEKIVNDYLDNADEDELDETEASDDAADTGDEDFAEAEDD